MDLSSQQFSALAADAQYFEAAPPINMLPISSARLAIGGARALSYAGGKVVAQHVFVIVGFQVPPTTQNVVGGQWLESSTEQWIEVHNPATNQVGGLERIKKDPTLLPWQVVTKVPQSTQAEMENAVENAKSAGRTWSRSSPMARCSSPLTSSEALVFIHVPMCPPFNWFLIQTVPYSNICYTFENENQRVQGYDIPVCQLVPQSTGLQTQSNLTRRAGVLWQAGTHFFRIQTVLPKYMIPGTRVNQDHLLDRTEPDSTFALIIMQYEAIPYNTVKYN